MPDAMENLRANYPQYKDIPDNELAEKMVKKYPVYRDAFAKYLKPAAKPAPAAAQPQSRFPNDTPEQAKARASIDSAQSEYQEVRRQHDRSLLAPLYAVTDPIQNFLSSVYGHQRSPQDVMTHKPLPAREQMLKGKGIGAQIAAEGAPDVSRKANPALTRWAESPSQNWHEAAAKATVRTGQGLATVDNALIIAALGPYGAAGSAGKVANLAVSGYFGVEMAKAAKDGLQKFKASGYKDKDALMGSIANAAVMTFAAKHGLKDALEMRDAAFKTSDPAKALADELDKRKAEEARKGIPIRPPRPEGPNLPGRTKPIPRKPVPEPEKPAAGKNVFTKPPDKAIPPDRVKALSSVPVTADYESQEYAKGMAHIAESKLPLYKSIEDVPNKEKMVYHGTWFRNIRDLTKSQVKGLMSTFPDAQTRHHGDVVFVYEPKGKIGDLAVTDSETAKPGKPIGVILNPSHISRLEYQERTLTKPEPPKAAAKPKAAPKATDPELEALHNHPARKKGFAAASDKETENYLQRLLYYAKKNHPAEVPQILKAIEMHDAMEFGYATLKSEQSLSHMHAAWTLAARAEDLAHERAIRRLPIAMAKAAVKPKVTPAKAPEPVKSAPQSHAQAVQPETKANIPPEKKVVAAAAKAEKTNADTGLTKTQEAYLAGELKKSVNTVSEDSPVTIKVPGDGKFTVKSVAQANQLHANVTGKPLIEGSDVKKTSGPTRAPGQGGRVPGQSSDKTPIEKGFGMARVGDKEFVGERQAQDALAAAKEQKSKLPKEKPNAAKTGVQQQSPPEQHQGNDKGGSQAVSSRSRVVPKAEGVQAKTEAVTPKPSEQKIVGTKSSAPVPRKGPVTLSGDEASMAGAHFDPGDVFGDKLSEAKSIKLTAEQADAVRRRLEKSMGAKGLDPKKFPALYESPAAKPRGVPGPNAPVVGGVPEVRGASGAPEPKKGLLRKPTVDDVRSAATKARAYVKEQTRKLSNILNRGTTGIERHAKETGNPSLLRAARKEAGTTGQINTIVAHTLPLIREALGGTDLGVQKFFHYLAESSLRGARARWEDLHNEVLELPYTMVDDPTRKITDERKPSLLDPKIQKKYIDILEKIEGRRRDAELLDADRDAENQTADDRIVYTGNERHPTHFSSDLSNRARNLFSNGAYMHAQILIAGAFDEAAQSVGKMSSFDPDRVGRGAEDFDAYGRNPKVQKALMYYREGIGQPLTKAYQANYGVDSEYLGPLETYFPMVPFREGGGKGHPTVAPKSAFERVSNPNLHFKTGLADRYDTSVPTVIDAISHSLKRNNRGALVNTLRDIGLAQDLPHGTGYKDAPKTMMVNGIEVPAVVKPWRGSTKVVVDGKVHFTQGQNMLVAKFAADELNPMLENADYDPSGALGKITQAYLWGPAAGIMHNYNLAGSLVAGTPFVGKGFGKIPGSIPGLKFVKAINDGISINPSDSSRAADIRLLAESGLLHPKTGTVTASKAFAEQIGIKHKPMDAIAASLYGINGTELRTRLQLLDTVRAVAEESGKEPTQEDIFNFVSQAGIYAHGLDSMAERVLKRAQLAPFITAGKTQLGTGARAVLGRTPLPEGLARNSKANLRARQLISSGIVGAVGAWYGAHYAYTGRLPDKDTKFNQIPVNAGDRKSWWGQQIFGKGEDQKFVSLDFFEPTLARGLKWMGGDAYINGMRKGDTWDKIAGQAHKDFINGSISPITNAPAVRMASTATIGKDLYITGYRGPGNPNHFSLEMIDTVEDQPMSIRRLAQQQLNAILNASPVTELAGQMSGIGYRRPDRKDDSAATVAFKTAYDILFPRTVPFQMTKKTKTKGLSVHPPRMPHFHP